MKCGFASSALIIPLLSWPQSHWLSFSSTDAETTITKQAVGIKDAKCIDYLLPHLFNMFN